MAPKTLTRIAVNASVAFTARLLNASAILSNHPLSFDGGPFVPPTHPKSPMTESIIVVIPAIKAVSVEIIVIICSRLKIQIVSSKGIFSPITFQGFV